MINPAEDMLARIRPDDIWTILGALGVAIRHEVQQGYSGEASHAGYLYDRLMGAVEK